MADDDDDSSDDGDELEAKFGIGSKARLSKKTPLELVVANGREAYAGLVAKDRGESFVVRCVSGVRYRFFNHRLNSIAIGDANNTSLTIMTSDGVIQLFGRNLDAIDDALALRTCATITEYSPDRYLPPTDQSKAFIERILVLLPPPPEMKERVTKAQPMPEEA